MIRYKTIGLLLFLGLLLIKTALAQEFQMKPAARPDTCVEPGNVKTLDLEDTQGNEITVDVLQANGDTLVIWLLDHEEERPMFEAMLNSFCQQGMTVWRVDLLAAYFLPRSSENIRTMPGDGVAALITAALKQTDKKILLAAYDRMPVVAMRGMLQWQLNQAHDSRFLGAAFFYPNLYGPPPVAGTPPELDPIVGTSNMPIVIFQPEFGAHRLRLPELMAKFWQSGTPAFSYLVPKVRDWFFMHDIGEDPNELKAASHVAPLLQTMARRMAEYAPASAPEQPAKTQVKDTQTIQGLVAYDSPVKAPLQSLNGLDEAVSQVSSVSQGVRLINFWATWCPPCVEELPSMNRLVEKYHGKPFSVFSIDFREDKKAVSEFLQKIPVHFPVLLDAEGMIAHQWNVFSLPSSFIVDHKGRIRYSVNRAIHWETPEVYQIIDQLLAEIQ